MPSSSCEGKEWSAERIAALAPRRILDIGPGAGTYAELLRPILPASHIAGLEIHRPYVERYDLAEKYDELVVGDVRAFAWQGDWDLVIFGDVLEHVELRPAMRAWRHARRHARHVLASVPIVHYPQGECEGNIHESHRVQYDEALVHAAFPGIQERFQGRQLGVYLASGTAPRQ